MVGWGEELEDERSDDGDPANGRILIPYRHRSTKDFPNTQYLFGPQTIINSIYGYIYSSISREFSLGSLSCKAALQISVHSISQHSNTHTIRAYLPERLLLRPELLSLLIDLTLHLQLNLAQLIIVRIRSTTHNTNTPFLLLGATALP